MTLHGIDVASYQGDISMAAVPGDFAIIKATGGTGYVNPACDAQFQAARAAGKRTGIYHFAHEKGCPGTAEQEAAFFLANVKGYLDGHTLLALDYESDNMTDVAWARTWLNIVTATTGVKPLIYLNGAAINGADWTPVTSADFGIWLAWYAVSTPTYAFNDYSGKSIDEVAPPFPCAMWQYTSTARLDGYGKGLDVSVFYGDGAAWDAYCRPSGAPISAPAPVAPAPAPAPAPATVAGPNQCIVEAGDSLSGIANQFGVDLGALIAANGIANPNLIYPGQVLNLPGKAAPAPAPRQCIVEAGDTLGGIAAQFGVDLGAIISVNGIANPNLIYPGQVLNLP